MSPPRPSPPGVQQVGAHALHPPPRAVLVPEAVLGLVGSDTPLSEGLLGLLQHMGEIFRVDVVEHVHRANCLIEIVAEHPLEGGVCVPQSAVEVHYRDELRGVLHNRAQPPVVVPRLTVRRRGSICMMRGTVTGVASLLSRGVHVSLPVTGPTATSVKYIARSL